MALAAQIVVESRRYSGWLDPRYPIGFWQAALAVTGDASGGRIAIDLVFQDALTSRLNSQMYSVERFGIRTDDEVNRDMQISAINMGGPTNRGFDHSYAVEVLAIGGTGRAAVRAEMLGLTPWFLGSQRTPAITASLSLVADNVDTIQYTFEAEGYRWSARSVVVDGGPQRPPTGIYRQ